jgi:hypothetical protein
MMLADVTVILTVVSVQHLYRICPQIVPWLMRTVSMFNYFPEKFHLRLSNIVVNGETLSPHYDVLNR